MCCQLTLRSDPVPPSSTAVQDLPVSTGMPTPPPSPSDCPQRTQSARSNSRAQSQTALQQSNDCQQPSVGNKRTAMKSSLPLTKGNEGRRPGSGRRAHQRSPGTPVEGQQRQQHRAAADETATISSSSDAYSDDTTSSANGHTSTSPTPGLSQFTQLRQL